MCVEVGPSRREGVGVVIWWGPGGGWAKRVPGFVGSGFSVLKEFTNVVNAGRFGDSEIDSVVCVAGCWYKVKTFLNEV